MKRLAWLFLLLPVVASAHAIEHPRRLSLHASPSSLELRFGYELGAAKAADVRRLFDHDRDGALDAAEVTALERYLERRAVGAFELRRDGKPVEATDSTRRVAGVEAARGSLTVVVTRTWTLGDGAHAFTVYDEGDATGHLPVKLEASGVTVLFGGVKLGRAYDLPARTEVSLRVRPAR